MFRPYKELEETEEFIVYEYRTVYLYVLYGILATIAVGHFASISNVLITGIALMILYFFLISTQTSRAGTRLPSCSI